MYQHSCSGVGGTGGTPSVRQNPNWCQKEADRTRRAKRHPSPTDSEHLPDRFRPCMADMTQSFVQSVIEGARRHTASRSSRVRGLWYLGRMEATYPPTWQRRRTPAHKNYTGHSCTTQSFPLCPTWEPVSPSNTSILLGPSTYSVWD